MRFTRRQRKEAYGIVLRACELMLDHRPEIHYSQRQDRRWQGIEKGLRVVRGEFPRYADCSAMGTWILWNAVTHAKRDIDLEDIVNGQAARWMWGNTASMRQHGKVIPFRTDIDVLRVGDQVHYGSGDGRHMATYIGKGFVFSHGSESGPYKLPVRYRRDFNHVRRVILAP